MHLTIFRDNKKIFDEDIRGVGFWTDVPNLLPNALIREATDGFIYTVRTRFLLNIVNNQVSRIPHPFKMESESEVSPKGEISGFTVMLKNGEKVTYQTSPKEEYVFAMFDRTA